jgi:signal transduction histidine kinase
MKLLEKYNRINLRSTIAIFIIAGIAFYFALHYTLLKQVGEDLKIEQNEIINYVKLHDSLPAPIEVKDQRIVFEPTTKPHSDRKFKTLKLSDDNDEYRQLTFSIEVQGKWYDAHIAKSLETTEIITRTVFLITFFTIFLILIVTFVINRTILKKLWQPFYHSLDILQHFKIGNREPVKFTETNIDEFQFMNTTLTRTTGKAIQDYEALKIFTENASHELQTPLAIIRSKLEVMMQGDNLNEQQFSALQSATEAINRLSRMNQSLLLLTKIENEQFSLRYAVDMTLLVNNKIEQFKELWEDRSLRVFTDISQVSISANQELMEILLNNLFSNAYRHNYDGGEIYVSLDKHALSIANTGDKTVLDEKHLFQRFYTPSGSKGNGLGLAVVRQICESSGLSISYRYEKDRHNFSVLFI